MKTRRLAATQTCTDSQQLGSINAESLTGQLRLLLDYLGRFLRTLLQLRRIRRDDLAYAVTDYWFDALPVIFSRARRKLMILGMCAPTMKEIIRRQRPDVTGLRLNSIYYWLSQGLSLRWFRHCRHKRLLYVDPAMKPALLRLGYREHELVYISNGFDLAAVEQAPEQTQQFDVIWVGRVHRQKGIDDLMTTLAFLAAAVENFRAVLVGRVEDDLKPQIQLLGLERHVTFTGYVSEAEKFRLFKASRLFLMPSRYESWGIVVAEALASGTPVVAYELEAYRPIFGDLIRYVRPFDEYAFKQAALEELKAIRQNPRRLDAAALAAFKQQHSWEAARERFTTALIELSMQ